MIILIHGLKKIWIPRPKADFIIHGMNSMNIPCMYSDVHGFSQAMKTDNRAFNRLGLRKDAGQTVNVCFNSTDIEHLYIGEGNS